MRKNASKFKTLDRSPIILKENIEYTVLKMNLKEKPRDINMGTLGFQPSLPKISPDTDLHKNKSLDSRV